MRSGLLLDLRHSLRALLSAPLTTVPAVVTLAVAMAANTSVFAVVNAILLRDLSVEDPDRLMSVSSDFAASHGYRSGAGWSHPMWQSLQQRSGLFGGILAWHAGGVTLGGAAETQPAAGYFVSGEFFSTLGVRPLHGRLITPEDDQPEAPPVAVISYRTWVRRFAGAPSAIGSTLTVDALPVTIIGITPPAFSGLEIGRPFEIALPIHAERAVRGARSALFEPRRYNLLIMLRLGSEQTIASATTSLRNLQAEIVPAGAPSFVREPFTLVPASGGAVGPASAQLVYRRPLLMLTAAVMLVLLVACLNIANLLAARGASRRGDLAVRAALGAGCGRTTGRGRAPETCRRWQGAHSRSGAVVRGGRRARTAHDHRQSQDAGRESDDAQIERRIHHERGQREQHAR